ncbi:chromate transporter [Mycoplasmopsis mustelae]|uniref:Chromate transporter n=1 Tax=Mycoplasmopsis mustelae TaxID=171289 RepID=A0A4R7UCX8_9BACT|nr:chromate transporter [Mycoplasmopsis mustelae]TDV24259.1 chromate transporter [Mycoplasmopsis mustelae]
MKTQEKKVGIRSLIFFVIKVTFVGFGGGNALMPIIKREAVEKRKWITQNEFDDIVIVTNMLPGASVIQTLSYICIHLLGKWKGTIVTLFAILPHVLMAFGFLLLINYIPPKYVKILSVGVLVSIIAFLLEFGIRYLKQAQKSMYLPLWFCIFIFSFVYCFFVPAPYNVPVVAIFIVLSLYFIVYFILKKKHKQIKLGDK